VKRIAVGAAVLCWATACATPISSFRPLPPDDPQPAQLLANWAERASQRQRMRARARLAVDREDGSVQLRGKQRVVLERPSHMRVEVLGFLDQPLAVIATDGEGFEVYRAEDQSYQTGAVDEDLLWNEAGIDLTPDEAVAVLLGVPISEPLPAPENAVRDAQGRIRIDLPDDRGNIAERVIFDSEGNLHAFELLGDSGAVVWSAQFDAYRDVGGSPFAHSIEVDVRSGRTHAKILFSRVELNPDLPPGMFRLFPTGEGGPPGSGADGR
jgi:hypothetical protein